MNINRNVYMVQQIIRVTSEKNSSGDRMVMPRDHDQHRHKLQKFKRLVLVEFRMLFAEQFFLHFPHAVPGEFGNRQDPFGKFERCELRAQMLQDEFFTENIMI